MRSDQPCPVWGRSGNPSHLSWKLPNTSFLWNMLSESMPLCPSSWQEVHRSAKTHWYRDKLTKTNDPSNTVQQFMCKGRFLKLNLSYSSLPFYCCQIGWHVPCPSNCHFQRLKSVESPEGARCQNLSQHSQLRSRGILKLPGTQMEPWTTQYGLVHSPVPIFKHKMLIQSKYLILVLWSNMIQRDRIWWNHTNSFWIECVHLRINATLTHSVSNGCSIKLQNPKALIPCPTTPNGESRSSIIAAYICEFFSHCHAILILSCGRYSLVGVYSRFRLFKVTFPFWKRHDKACD